MRIGEIADNITKYTKGVIEDSLEFSDAVKLEISKMNDLIKELHKLTDMTFNSRKTDLMDQINSIEEEVDNMRSKLVNDHLDRLKQGKCDVSYHQTEYLHHFQIHHRQILYQRYHIQILILFVHTHFLPDNQTNV